MTSEQRWSEDAWHERLELIADLIPQGASVLDLGAGAQGLRDLVTGPYTPADLTSRTPDTLPFNVETDTYPVGQWDVVVASGVFEHIANPDKAIEVMRGLAPTAIVTYQPSPGKATKERIRNGWHSHLTSEELEALCRHAGFKVELAARWQRQLIYRLT
jgi:hypothetical protein